MMLSVILLTCESHRHKGFCVRHALRSIINQHYRQYEIILVDNGNDQDCRLTDYLSELHTKFPAVQLTTVKIGKTINRGAARNRGAAIARGEILVFMDEDVILVDPNTFCKLHHCAGQHNWGCGAVRLWTKENWFDLHCEATLLDITYNDYEHLLDNVGAPASNIRGSVDTAIETRSFIGHFGFCRTTHFMATGGFTDLGPANSFDDDLLNIKLFQALGRPVLINDITIVHINHPIHGSRDEDYEYYLPHLFDQDIFSFDSEALIFGQPTELITQLRPIHQHPVLMDAYGRYQQKRPLNAQDLSGLQMACWTQYMALELDEYCRLAMAFLQSPSVDNFIQCQACDFDNVGPVLESILESGLATIASNGDISPTFDFCQWRKEARGSISTLGIDPLVELNQFPCDADSVHKRMLFIKERYPFAEFLRIGIIGDDDLLSLELQDQLWTYPIVIEKDKRLTNLLQKGPRGKLFELDLLSYPQATFQQTLDTIPRVHTFITDPPYTFQGLLLFILTGINILALDGQTREFYVVANPMIIGRHFDLLVKLLYESNIYLAGFVPGISSYPLPAHYPETKRATKFAQRHGFAAPKVSSTSNLYIFKTAHPNVAQLAQHLKLELVYEHYHP